MLQIRKHDIYHQHNGQVKTYYTFHSTAAEYPFYKLTPYYIILKRNSEQFHNVNHNYSDFIFCIGLLDHLDLEVQNEFLDLLSLRQHSKIILSKSNEKNIFFRFLNVGRGVEFEHQFLILKKIYLLKIPKTSLVIHLTFIGSRYATEVIYFLASKMN